MSRISLIFYFFYILSFYFKLLFHSAVKKTSQYISLADVPVQAASAAGQSGD